MIQSTNTNNNSIITPSSTKHKIGKFSLILIIYLIWIICKIFVYLPDKSWPIIYCIKDTFIEELKGVTNYLSQNLDKRDFILILSGAIIDFYFFLFFFFFIKHGRSWKPYLAIAFFYLFRGLVAQKLNLFGFYDTYIFKFPGFYSFSIPYFRSPDFFYSGHAGVLILIGLILRDFKHPFFFYLSIFLATYEGFSLVILRAHYVIDIIFGVIAGHYFYIAANYFGEYIDNYFLISDNKDNNINMGSMQKKEQELGSLDQNVIIIDRTSSGYTNKTDKFTNQLLLDKEQMI